MGNQNEASMSEDDNMIPFYKDHGFVGELSNVIESVYDLLRILEYCVSDEMSYTPETKAKIQDLINWIRTGEGDGTNNHLTFATNFPGAWRCNGFPVCRGADKTAIALAPEHRNQSTSILPNDSLVRIPPGSRVWRVWVSRGTNQ